MGHLSILIITLRPGKDGIFPHSTPGCSSILSFRLCVSSGWRFPQLQNIWVIGYAGKKGFTAMWHLLAQRDVCKDIFGTEVFWRSVANLGKELTVWAVFLQATRYWGTVRMPLIDRNSYFVTFFKFNS